MSHQLLSGSDQGERVSRAVKVQGVVELAVFKHGVDGEGDPWAAVDFDGATVSFLYAPIETPVALLGDLASYGPFPFADAGGLADIGEESAQLVLLPECYVIAVLEGTDPEDEGVGAAVRHTDPSIGRLMAYATEVPVA